MKKLFFLSCLLMGLFGCENKEAGNQKMVLNSPAKPLAVLEKASANENETPEKTSPDVNRKIIKEGEINFETTNTKETRNAIYNTLEKLGGYIEEENETNDTTNTGKEYVLKARVPENNFDRFLDGVTSKAVRINFKNIRVKDVTTKYIDITTQINNKKVLESTYLGLLKQTNKMSDVLQIENKLTEIRTTIDSTQAELNYLSKQVAYSSLEITFYTKKTAKDNGQSLGNKLISAFTGGWDILGVIFFGCLAIWPVWIIITISYFTFRGWQRKQPPKKADV